MARLLVPLSTCPCSLLSVLAIEARAAILGTDEALLGITASGFNTFRYSVQENSGGPSSVSKRNHSFVEEESDEEKEESNSDILFRLKRACRELAV
jgi:hypothetical protein